MISKYLNTLAKTAEENYLNNINQNLKKLDLKLDTTCDVGCGNGDATKKILAGISNNITGIDGNQFELSKAALKGLITKKINFEEKNWNIKEQYDLVVTNQVIEHVFSIDNFLLNCLQLVKKNKFLLISTDNLGSWHNIIAMLIGYHPFSLTNMSTKVRSIGNPLTRNDNTTEINDYMIHRAVFSYRALKDFVKSYDLKIIKEICSGYYPFPNGSVSNFFAKKNPSKSVYIAFLLQKK